MEGKELIGADKVLPDLAFAIRNRVRQSSVTGL